VERGKGGEVNAPLAGLLGMLGMLGQGVPPIGANLSGVARKGAWSVNPMW
jgi:hypothetical protein